MVILKFDQDSRLDLFCLSICQSRILNKVSPLFHRHVSFLYSYQLTFPIPPLLYPLCCQKFPASAHPCSLCAILCPTICPSVCLAGGWVALSIPASDKSSSFIGNRGQNVVSARASACCALSFHPRQDPPPPPIIYLPSPVLVFIKVNQRQLVADGYESFLSINF